MFSSWNCAAVNYVGTKKPNIMLEFNLLRFLINAAFILLIMHLGINVMKLSLTTFGLTLFFTWFTLHMVEAFYSASFIRRINDNL